MTAKNVLTAQNDRFLRHTEKNWIFLFTLRSRKLTALYFLDRLRYADYIDSNEYTGNDFVNWHERKQTIQLEYQRKLEREGKILKEIFLKRVADKNSRAVDYLNWLSWVWDLYQKNLKDEDFIDEGFVKFCQSDLIFDEELTETWIFKNKNKVDKDS